METQIKTGYSITDNERYISINSHKEQVIVTDKNQAHVFKTFDAARHCLDNMRRTIKIFHWTVQPIKLEVEINDDIVQDKIKQPIHNKSDTKDKAFDWEKQINDMIEFQVKLKQYTTQMGEKQKDIEKEICDIYHYIEFFSLNAAQGYNMYRMLKERLIERRKIKDELVKIEIVLDSSPDDVVGGRLKARFDGLDNRQYEHRVLKELFNV